MRKKISLLTAFALLAALPMWAQSIDRATALQKAEQFMNKKSRTFHKELTQHRAPSNDPQPYYVFNADDGKGFVIVSGDERMPDILGYGLKTPLDTDHMPQNLRSMLQGYADEYDYVQSHNVRRSTIANLGEPIESKLKAKWDQDEPFNNDCPDVTLYSDEECTNLYTLNTKYAPNGVARPAVGCIATAMAMVYYHVHQPGNAVCNDIKPHNGVWSAIDQVDNYHAYRVWQKYDDVGFPAGTTFDWDNMLPRYTQKNGNGYTMLGTQTERSAVAKLMHVMAAACKMNYGSFSAVGSSAIFEEAHEVPYRYLGFNNNTVYNQRYYKYQDWLQHLYDEVKASGAVFFGGTSSKGGHGFVVDGYDKEDFFSINWGWSGSADGYYRIKALKPNDTGIGDSQAPDGYNMYQSFIGGFYPDAPAMTPDVRSLYLSVYDYPVSIENNTISIPLYFNITNMKYAKPFTVYLSLFIYDSNGNEIVSYPVNNGTPLHFELYSTFSGTPSILKLDKNTVGNNFNMCIKYKLEGSNEWITVPGPNKLSISIDGDNKISTHADEDFKLSVVSKTTKPSYSQWEKINFTTRLKITEGFLHETMQLTAIPYSNYTDEPDVDLRRDCSKEIICAEKGDEFDLTYDYQALSAGRYSISLIRQNTPSFYSIPLFDIIVDDDDIDGVRKVTVTETSADAPRYDLNGRPVGDTHRGIVISKGRKYITK